MSKKALLNVIPKEAAETILLPKIKSIEVLHRNKPKKFIPTNVFLKTKAVAIKFHNPHLELTRRIAADMVTPVVQVKDLSGKVVDRFDSGNMTTEQIWQRIEAANAEGQGEMKGGREVNN